MVQLKNNDVYNHNIHNCEIHMKAFDTKDLRESVISETCTKSYSYEDALDISGTGSYNYYLLLVTGLVVFSMGVDMFGLALVVTGCSCEFKLTLAEKGILSSVPFLGPILMAYTWGYISDTWGRKKTLILAMSVSFVCSVLSTLSPDWITLAIIRLVSISFSCCAQSVGFAFLGESCSQKVRGSFMLMMSALLHLGPVFYYPLAYFILDLDFAFNLGFLGFFTPWRLFSLIIALPGGVGALLMLGLYESPKFLANDGREDEAMEVLTKIWIRNGGEPDAYPVKILILEEKTSRRDVPLLQSIWEQTAPLFRPPLLKRTLQLYYITAVVYATANSFFMWLPFIANAFFSSLKNSDGGNSGLCSLLEMGTVRNGNLGNSTSLLQEPHCNNKIEEWTTITGASIGLLFGLINLCLAKVSSKKKLVTKIILATSSLSGVGLALTREPISAIILYIMFLSAGNGIGLVASYLVVIFPTSYRGMVACLGVIVARVSALLAINLVGSIILVDCQTTFLGWSAFVLSGVIMALFLPSDTKIQKDVVKTNS